MVKELTQALKLTSSQQTKVLAVLNKQHKQMEAMFKNHKPGQRPGKADFAKMQALHAQATKSINAILTSKQRKLYAAWQAKHHHGGPGGMGRRYRARAPSRRPRAVAFFLSLLPACPTAAIIQPIGGGEGGDRFVSIKKAEKLCFSAFHFPGRTRRNLGARNRSAIAATTERRPTTGLMSSASLPPQRGRL